jgi:hypothetical protein
MLKFAQKVCLICLCNSLFKNKNCIVFPTSKRLGKDEEICFDIKLIAIIKVWIVIIQLWIRFVNIIVFFVIRFFPFIFMFVFLCNVDFVFVFIVFLIFIIFVFLALNFKEEIWRVLIRVFVDYLQRLFWKWQDKIEWCRFCLEISFVEEEISVVLKISWSSV